MKITVKVFDKNGEILSKAFGEGSVRAGRSEFCDIVLPGESISRSHVELRVTATSVYLTNLSGVGRVKVNGKALETTELSDGDEVTVGPYRLVVFHGERDVASAPLEEVSPAAEMPLEGEPPAQENQENFGGGFENSEEPGAQENAVPDEGSPEALAENPVPQPDFAENNLAPFPEAEPAPAFEGTAALNRAETVIEAKPLVAKLLFTDGPKKGDELLLEAFEVTFGRSKKADIFLDDEKLSRKHAKITRVGMGYRLIDLNSRNGTYVNGVRILEHPLCSFDVIEMGSTKIKFLIHDLVLGDEKKGAMAPLGGQEQTKSIQMEGEPGGVVLDFPKNRATELSEPVHPGGAQDPSKKRAKLVKVALIAVIALLGLLLILPSGKNSQPKTSDKTAVQDKNSAPLPPTLPKEYSDLTPDMQRLVEGQYNLAVQAAEKENFQEAVAHLKKIHEVLPYYKNSRDLLDQYSREWQRQQSEAAEEKAKQDEKQDLAIYLEDGLDYLKAMRVLR